MGLIDQKYPYTNSHELNLDWVIKQIIEITHEVNEFKVVNQISFKGAWDITQQYPAWAFVDNGGNGFLSIKPVPAGVELTNEDYWRLVANYSALYADFQNRIINLEKKTNYVTPEEFGAIGDGVNNDTIAMQNAINYASEENVDLVVRGSYRITSTLYLNRAINIVGDSKYSFGDHSIWLDAGSEDIYLFSYSESESVRIKHCTFNSVCFSRRRTEPERGADGLGVGLYATAFHGLNECTFNDCGFIGFKAVCDGGAINYFNGCSATYCSCFVDVIREVSEFVIDGANFYKLNNIVEIKNHASNLTISNSWIEDFKSLIHSTTHSRIYNLNIVNSTLTNNYDNAGVFIDLNGSNWQRVFINFNNSYIISKLNFVNPAIRTTSHLITCDSCKILYGGSGEVANITGNSNYYNLNNGDIASLNNTGFDVNTATAYVNPYLKGDTVSSIGQFGWHAAASIMSYITANNNRMVMLPVYLSNPPSPDSTKYFVFNKNAVTSGDPILTYYDTALHITKVVFSL